MVKKKVLIADDELYIRLLVKSMLDNGYTVLEAGNGEEAVSITCVEKPDIILMDILMPKLDGYTACHEIKKNPATTDIPIIMITGIGHELNRKLAAEMGVADYITKPFSLDDLMDRVKRCQSAPLPVG